jgi:hypothetical protein
VCHASPGLQMQLASGEVIPATVNPQTFSRSVHGSVLQCSACHTDIAGYPHPAQAVLRSSVRDLPYLLRSAANCGSCHPDVYNDYLGSAHAQALSAGKSEAAVCSDCHGAHDIRPANPAEVGLALGPAVYACAACHPDEFHEYQDSVHGQAVLQEGDLNAPTCVDCHGVHGMHSAKDAADFRTQSVALCASCHSNVELMQKHDRSTEILSTYVADFHGTSAQLFSAKGDQSPPQALCYDCHGNHAVSSTVSTSGLQLKENLLKACQKCHPDASLNFPAAWLGHSEASPDRSAPVFWTQLFFTGLTVTTILGLIGLVILDLARSARDWAQGGK